MNEILHAEEFQQIESAWRGLHYLVFNSETDAKLKIRVMNVGKKELYRNLQALSRRALGPEPALQEDLRGRNSASSAASPTAASIADYHFSHLPTDVQLMRDLSKIAGCRARAVLRRRAIRTCSAWTPGPSSPIRATSARSSTRPTTRPGSALRDSADSRYVGLCMPRVLSRLPYGAKSEPVEEFAFEEETDGHTGEKYAWMNAAYAMAANINRAYKEYGWCTRIRGVQSGGEVINLPTHTFPTDDGGVDLKCPTEIAISDRREAELAKAGLIPLMHRKNTDKAAFIGAQSVYKPHQYFGPNGVEATASDNLSSRLPYMFAVSRFAHYLKCMVRDKIGSTKEKRRS